jgi:hypothetical protein
MVLSIETFVREVVGHYVLAHVRRPISKRIINSVGMVETEVVTQFMHLETRVLDLVIVHNWQSSAGSGKCCPAGISNPLGSLWDDKHGQVGVFKEVRDTF